MKQEMKAVGISLAVIGTAFVATSKLDVRVSVVKNSYLHLEWPRSMSNPLITLVAGKIPHRQLTR
ncbi:hypothetical protein [Marinobacter sp. SS13-12]|uniref:hypothetical protein n=1 Tax=Marinobacter sp. SS13-12 TaxID=3050451 RepID=UPI0025532FE8|nr:hypothetical protein [Marinobacter sp. SS13-12]MDK8465922.1 hypothetical protein [Marinobacter sp. SS13-12]